MFWKCCAYTDSKGGFKPCVRDARLQAKTPVTQHCSLTNYQNRDIELHYYKGICPQFQAMACQMKIQNNGRDTQLTEDYIRWNHILIFF